MARMPENINENCLEGCAKKRSLQCAQVSLQHLGKHGRVFSSALAADSNNCKHVVSLANLLTVHPRLHMSSLKIAIAFFVFSVSIVAYTFFVVKLIQF